MQRTRKAKEPNITEKIDDQIEDPAPFVDIKLQRDIELDTECRSALLGYTMIDFSLESFWLFGLWNYREAMQADVEKLTTSYRERGVDNRSKATAIPIVVLEGQVDPRCLVDISAIYQSVTTIAWAVSPPPVTVPAAGGNHRHNALLAYIKETDTEIKNIKEQIDAFVDSDDSLRPSLVKALEKATTLRKSLGPWLAAVYNGSKKIISVHHSH